MARKEMRHMYSQLGMDMRAVANAIEVPVITAWQINRAGNSVDTPTQEYIAESWDIVMHVDALLALGQSDAEEAQNIMRLIVLEHRYSDKRGVIHLRSDMDKCRIEPLQDSLVIENQPTEIEKQCTGCYKDIRKPGEMLPKFKIDPGCPKHGTK
jgi:hypothetical protein